MRDAGFNCLSREYGFSCRTKFISSTSSCKHGQEMNALILPEVRKPLIFDSNTLQESTPSIKAPSLLFDRCACKSSFLVANRLSEASQEVIAFGMGDILKFFGVWRGRREWNAVVSTVSGK